MKLDFDDILIVPAAITNINSRQDVDIYYGDGNLPIFTAPMDTVINNDNIRYYMDNRINPILPRGEIYKDNYVPNDDIFISVSLDEFKTRYIDNTYSCNGVFKVLIDIANGHMSKLHELIKAAKKKYGGKIILMVGNVANPTTYNFLSTLNVDYVRVGIGNGNGCLTTQQTGIGYPMASLIMECKAIKTQHNFQTDIVADGGFKKYSDIIKAIACGADYCMLGSIFNKALESAGETFLANIKHDGWTQPGERVDQYSDIVKNMFRSGAKFYKKFRGMSTKEVQRTLGATEIKTSEGVSRMQEVEYTISGWVENFEHYLRSAMSYSNANTLKEFQDNSDIIQITDAAFRRFNK